MLLRTLSHPVRYWNSRKNWFLRLLIQAFRQTLDRKTALSLDFPETIIDERCQLCLFKSRAEWSDGLSAEGRNSGSHSSTAEMF
jgi:hypothetical protein